MKKLIGIIALILVVCCSVVLFVSIKGKEKNNSAVQKVKKVALMLFIPINSLICLPQIAKISGDMETKDIPEEKIKKRIIILGVLIFIAIIFEIGYLKDFQNGIIQLLNK